MFRPTDEYVETEKIEPFKVWLGVKEEPHFEFSTFESVREKIEEWMEVQIKIDRGSSEGCRPSLYVKSRLRELMDLLIKAYDHFYKGKLWQDQKI